MSGTTRSGVIPKVCPQKSSRGHKPMILCMKPRSYGVDFFPTVCLNAKFNILCGRCPLHTIFVFSLLKRNQLSGKSFNLIIKYNNNAISEQKS